MQAGYFPLLIQQRVGYFRRFRFKNAAGDYADITGWEFFAQIYDKDRDRKYSDIEVSVIQPIITAPLGPDDWHVSVRVSAADSLIRYPDARWDLLAGLPGGGPPELSRIYLMRGPVQYLEGLSEEQV
jgi:hypothetical protein